MFDNKKILIVLPWSKHGAAGAEQSTYLILNNLSNKFNFHVIVIAKKGTDQGDVESKFNKDIQIQVIFASRGRKSIFRISKAIRKIRPDLIIGNVLYICTNTILAKIISFHRCRVISVNRGMDLDKKIEKIHARFVQIFSDKVIVVSQGIKNYLVKELGLNSKKIEVIYNSFDLENIKKKSKESISVREKAWDKNKKTIIYVGRFEERTKDLTTLLEAFAKVKKQKDSNFLLVGDGEEKKNLKSLAKHLNIQENIFFLGWQENPYKFIRVSDALVLSSKFEGFGRVLVEALALGVPVISTDCPSGPAEILENGKYGKLVLVGDYEAMAEAILETLENSTNPKLLQKRARDFSVEKLINKYLKLINSEK